MIIPQQPPPPPLPRLLVWALPSGLAHGIRLRPTPPKPDWRFRIGSILAVSICAQNQCKSW
jgi:hypothetical protein